MLINIFFCRSVYVLMGGLMKLDFEVCMFNNFLKLFCFKIYFLYKMNYR